MQPVFLRVDGAEWDAVVVVVAAERGLTSFTTSYFPLVQFAQLTSEKSV